jgi:hypothetical protein
MADKNGDAEGGRWLILFYQVPPKPPYLRVKISRHLGKVGALAVKPTVYVLPKSGGALEDFQWVARELAKEGGDATICQARLVEGLRDDLVERMFNDARRAAYRGIQREARGIRGTEPKRQAAQIHLQRCLSDLREIDFFQAPGRHEAEAAVGRLYHPPMAKPEVPVHRPLLRTADYRGRTWVTRTGIHVDRIACSWLIRRFIDPRAHLKFVAAKGYVQEKGELRFDMFDGEFTHEGEDCSFEVLLTRFGIADAALRALSKIVHDIDLRDGKFRREEAAGVERLIAGICMAHPKDDERLRRGKDLFDDLYEYYHRKGD